MTVLVTGGAGFIGSSLVHELVGRGRQVRVLDDLSTGLASNLDGLDVELVVGSITDAAAVTGAARGVSQVVHLGARGSVPRSIAEPAATHEVNVTGTVRVLDAARALGAQVILASSSSVYGSNARMPKREDQQPQPISPYAASKLAAEAFALSYRAVYGLDVLALRLFNVYGPRQRPDHPYAQLVARSAWRALAGEPIVVDGDGGQTRDFTHVDAVVDVIVDALDRRLAWDGPVNLGFGSRVSVNDVVAEIARQAGPVEIVHGPPRTGDMRDTENDPALMRRLFPSVESVPLADGIATVLDWMRREAALAA